jgi:IS30 family transposase
MHRLNNRPRKTLNYRTPHTVFFEEFNRKAT